jgi:hypothetical protein
MELEQQQHITKPKITPAKKQANKRYYEKHKEEIIDYVNNYIKNRRHTDDEYRKKINGYYKNKYDDVARQKKKEYYLKKKALSN